MNSNSVEEKRKNDIRYLEEEIFKINGKLNIVRSLNEKRKIQKEFIEKMNIHFNNQTKKYGYHLNIPVIHINKNENFILDYFI